MNAMKNHPNDVAVQGNCLAALAVIARSDAGRPAVVEADPVSAMMDAMKNHPNDAMQHYCALALTAIARSDAGLPAVIEAGGVPVITNAMNDSCVELGVSESKF